MTTDTQIRCARCNRLLAEVATRPWRIRCSRCKGPNVSLKEGPAANRGVIDSRGKHALKKEAMGFPLIAVTCARV